MPMFLSIDQQTFLQNIHNWPNWKYSLCKHAFVSLTLIPDHVVLNAAKCKCSDRCFAFSIMVLIPG